jgi:bisanhydrobacterioruberin hydratase
MQITKTSISIILLLIVYTVGVVSVWTGHGDEIMQLTWANLLFSAAIFIINAEHINLRYLTMFCFAFLVGYIVEVIGVQTGLIFGHYRYGNILGIRIFETPLIIGINWAVLSFATAAILQKFQFSIWLKSLSGAVLMVAYDMILEPVAVQTGMWQWENENIPLQNYVAWFVVSFLLLLSIFSMVDKLKNKVAPYLLLIQIIFFILILVHYGYVA